MELSTYKADQVTKQPGIPDPKEQILSLLKSADCAREDVNKSEEWRLLQKVREFVYSLRFPEQGFSKWRPLFAAGGCAIVLALCLASSTRKTHYYHYPENYLRVIQNLDPCLPDGSCGYRFAVQDVLNGIPGDVAEMQFCRSLQPRFEAGHILKWIRYTDLGSCKAIDGYDVVRDANHLPVLAPNCQFDWPHNHLTCPDGKAKF